MDDISTKFGSYKKSWGFGNLSIAPLICSSFSNIVPLKSPIFLSSASQEIKLTTDHLNSLMYNYVFLLISANESITPYFELHLSLGDEKHFDYYFDISITDSECIVKNMKLREVHHCNTNQYYKKFIGNITDGEQKQELLWISWYPFQANDSLRDFSIGIGSAIDNNVIASLSIYGNGSVSSYHLYLDYMTLYPPTNKEAVLTVSPIQLATPKICLSEWYKSNKIDLGNTWSDDCNDGGWELRKYAHIYEDQIYLDNHSSIEECRITNLNTNPVTKLATDCFHGPFKGCEPHAHGDYVSRFFYVFSHINYDIIEVNLYYYGLCTWNPKTENDTAYVFKNNEAKWKSAPKYEFVEEYCEGYSLYSDWILYTEYQQILNPNLITCLHL
eukprot:406289_1